MWIHKSYGARLGSSNFGTSNPHFESLKLNPPRQVTISEDLPTLPSFSSLDLALFPSGSSALQFPSSPPSSRINKSHSPPACPRRPLSMFQLPTTSSGLPPLPPPLSRSRSSINMLPTSANGSMENSNLFLENPPTRQEFVSSPLSTLLYAAKELSTLERLNHATFSTPLIESTMGISSSPLSSSPTSVPRHFDLSLNSEVFNSLSPLSGTSSSSDFSQSSSPTCSFTSLSNATSKLDPTPSYSSLKTFSSTSPKETLPTFTNSEKRRKGFFCPDCEKKTLFRMTPLI
ncbi:hypothetical protein HMI55_003337 [Coelomomyces lativittatus]|nr:hypothetical protein HMI55_003337 [Coelomomyces lativittatus]